MARSTRKSSARGKSAKRRPASTAKAAPVESPAEETDLDELAEVDEADEADEKDAADEKSAKGAKSAKDGPSRAGGKDPVSTKGAARKKAGAKKPSAKGTKDLADRPRGGEVAEKAKDSTRTGAKKAAAQESRRGPRRVATVTQNPRWLVPAALTFLLLGLCYLVTFYLTSGQLPLPIGDWNLAVGFGALMVGGGMFMFWK